MAFHISNNKVYFFGGVIAINREVNVYSQDFWSYCFEKNIFENVKFTLNKRVNVPTQRGGHTFTCHNDKNKIYLFGGKNENERFNDLFEYDICKNIIK